MESTGAITSEDDLDTVLNETAGHLNALHGRLVDACVLMLADRTAWAGPGVERPELYLAWKVGLSTARAKQIVEIAERATRAPGHRRRVAARRVGDRSGRRRRASGTVVGGS